MILLIRRYLSCYAVFLLIALPIVLKKDIDSLLLLFILIMLNIIWAGLSYWMTLLVRRDKKRFIQTSLTLRKYLKNRGVRGIVFNEGRNFAYFSIDPLEVENFHNLIILLGKKENLYKLHIRINAELNFLTEEKLKECQDMLELDILGGKYIPQ